MSSPTAVALAPSRRDVWSMRFADYLELTKPRIAVLELVTVGVAACVASRGWPADAIVLLHALIGTALVAASASTLNQWLEVETDSRMPRTADRPLPAGRVSPAAAMTFGLATGLAGAVYLALLANPLTALIAAATWLLYVWVYTPLKTRTPANTAVGAVAGALPVLIGWAAVGGGWAGMQGLMAATLFLILFLWQFPHFMAIAWLYRDDYARGGMKMLTVVDPTGRRAGAQAIVAALALIPIAMLPAALYFAGPLFCVIAIGLSVWQLACAIRFFVRLDQDSARRLLRMSLIYLPLMLLLLMMAPLVFPRL